MQDTMQELCEVLDLIPRADDSIIKGILFDVGDVIINQYDNLAAEIVFILYGIRESLTMEFFADRGKTSSNPLYVFEHERADDSTKAEDRARRGTEDWLRRQTGNPGLELSAVQFGQIYTSIYKAENPEIILLMRTLGQMGYFVGILSNTNSIHFRFIMENVPGLKHVVNSKHIYASHITGHAKPSAESYLRPVRDFGIKPEQCLFVDNSPSNGRGARRVGLKFVLCDPKRIFDAVKAIVGLIAGTSLIRIST